MQPLIGLTVPNSRCTAPTVDLSFPTCRVYILGNQYEKARALAGTDPALLQYVDQQHTHFLLHAKNAEGLASIGNATEAIEIYAQQGDWGRVHTLAEQAGPQSVIKYSVR